MLHLSSRYNAPRGQGLGPRRLSRRILPLRVLSSRAIHGMPDPNGITIAWLRIGDLRLTDHEPLYHAVSAGDDVIPFFCLDDEMLNKGPRPDALGLPATGPHRLVALLYILRDLRSSLRSIGSDLIIATGSTEDTLQRLVTALLIDPGTRSGAGPAYLCLRYYTAVGDPMNTRIEQRVEAAFSAAAAQREVPTRIDRYWGHTTHHPSDIAVIGCEDAYATKCRCVGADLERVLELLSIHSTMTAFLENTLKKCSRIRKPLPRVHSLPGLPPSVFGAAKGEKPLGLEPSTTGDNGGVTTRAALKDIYAAAGAAGAYETLLKLFSANGATIKSFERNLMLGRAIEHREKSGMEFALTESEAQAHLHRILHNGVMHDYARTRMMASGIDSSAGLSAALSFGTVSPRTVYWDTMAAYFKSSNEGATVSDCAWHAPTSTSPGHCWLLLHCSGIRDYFLYASVADCDGEL